ncbi:peptide-methionine (S)-S-oxide reductase MsrA [Paraconexibacter antarcticus]|uniref:Peptide methionine sulfoxide reductase MsrA n=1 Tax=Paraconexibacter antarcticus TaxID=2949664 RepID=A0ABY5DSZ0_9ACTN|nr:peptide-methionine (S)-S-oxide reductase MsrA [Paraconexibacter antarcticus]UTI64796.1 peptide-methionine (S)-S-oxide reductase MsrA [Paraconexibacter antarcticus]
MFSSFLKSKTAMVEPSDALPGRDTALPVAETHRVLGTPLKPPFGAGIEVAYFGLGCFWGAERMFWQTPGVHSTAVGYQGGFTPNPTYEETCTNRTGHAEVVMVAFDPAQITYADLLKRFWEEHDPTQGMRQGNDVGTTYRSAIYTVDAAQAAAAARSREQYQAALSAAGRGEITTEIAPAGPFYYAEDYHQQYLDKNPNGYCNLAGTGVSCPIGTGVSAA